MIDTILVPTSGRLSDTSVFETALAVAKPLAAHLQFYHLRFSTSEAAVRTPHVDFCIGDAATASAFAYLAHEEEALSEEAAQHFKEFCRKNKVLISALPSARKEISAHYLQETDRPEARIIAHARHSDLIIMGRPHGADLMPKNLIETLLMASGRPVIIAPDTPPSRPLETIVVGWQETAEAARALGAAMPLLKLARKVVLVSVTAFQKEAKIALEQVESQLAWHHIAADIRLFIADPKQARAHISQEIAEQQADLLVVGGYGHGAWREALFGGVTSSIIDHAKCPVFLMH